MSLTVVGPSNRSRIYREAREGLLCKDGPLETHKSWQHPFCETFCNSNKPSLPLCPQKEGRRRLEKEAMGGSNRNKKPSVLRQKRDSTGTEEGQGEARDQRPPPFYGDYRARHQTSEKESRQADRTLELLPGSELQYSGCFYRLSHCILEYAYLQNFS